jgi:urease accessory protein UreE
MVDAMERIATDESLRRSLIDLGRRHLASFREPEKMACEYLDVFADAMRKPGLTPQNLK